MDYLTPSHELLYDFLGFYLRSTAGSNKALVVSRDRIGIHVNNELKPLSDFFTSLYYLETFLKSYTNDDLFLLLKE